MVTVSASSIKPLIVLFLATLFGLSLFVGLLFAGAGALSADATLYVDDDSCPNVGTGTAGDPFCTIQSAVDAAADLGEVRVAGGTYTGTQTVKAQDGWEYTQVFIIDRKSITVTGGYDGADWSAAPDRSAHPTIVDAERSGRGITVLGTGYQKVTLVGMTVTGGDYTGLGNPSDQSNQSCVGTGYDCGGGMRAKKVQLIMRDMIVYDNIAARTDQSRPTQGGGLDAHLLEPGSLILNSSIISNTAGGDRGYGGGVNLLTSELLIQDSLIEQNYAARSGGGLRLASDEPVHVVGTNFKDNAAPNVGGAIYATQWGCSGLYVPLIIEESYLTGNQAYSGPAIVIEEQNSPGDCSATLTNLILAKNHTSALSGDQALISVVSHRDSYQLELNHVTAADNEVSTFLELVSNTNSEAMTTTVNNTLVVSMSVGIAAEEEAGEMIINVKNPLMYNVSDHYLVVTGSPQYNLLNQVSGDPKLDADYHLLWGSAAINAGFAAGVLYDIDGDPRPAAYPDIGADELGSLFLPSIIK